MNEGKTPGTGTREENRKDASLNKDHTLKCRKHNGEL
jgi:hypothetical protein